MSIGLLQSVYYPESDGKPMGETDWHIAAIIRLRELLGMYFEGQQVYVAADMLLYYEQGNPKKFIVPDVFVVKDLKPKMRRIYRTWVERKSPSVVVEVTSTKTRKKDAVTKPELYAALGVPEYFVYDPDLGYLDPSLQGYRMIDGHYERIQPESDGCLISQELALRLHDDGQNLQLFRLDNGERLMTGRELAMETKEDLNDARAEANDAREEANDAREEANDARELAALESHKRREAEAEIERLKAELARQAARSGD